MCGIAGIVYHDAETPVEPERLDRVLQAMRHRGPDESGLWTGPGVAFAHARLVILDTQAGQQPMRSPDGRYVLTYNGEIYNFLELRAELEGLGHAFRTHCDTEVLLAAFGQWGEGCVERLRGMFAFAVWDTAERRLFLARDRIGIKPLLYAACDRYIAFASEFAPLLELTGCDRAIDPRALDLYLHYQYVPAPLTAYRSIRKLSPAHVLATRQGCAEAAPRPYWSVDFTPEEGLDEARWLERLDEGLSDSVRGHLVSDVPFGAFLSGGIDSSTVVALMARHLDTPVQAFTIGFQEQSYGEQVYAAAAARETGSEHHVQELRPRALDLFEDLLPRLTRHYGEPFADSSAIPTFYVSRLAASKVKMVLSGDGGDELFAGYNTYTNIMRGVVHGEVVPWWAKVAARLGWSPDARRMMQAAMGEPRDAVLPWHGQVYAYFRDEHRATLYRPGTARAIGASQEASIHEAYFHSARAKDCLSALLSVDLHTYLPGDILTKVDIASMMHSLEVRVPLLDHHVVELAARTPASLKWRLRKGDIEKKYLLKRYAGSLYSERFFDRPKQGFGVPIDHWLSGPLYEETRARLLEDAGLIRALFEPSAVEELVGTPQAVRGNSPRVWALLCLQAWEQAYAPRWVEDGTG